MATPTPQRTRNRDNRAAEPAREAFAVPRGGESDLAAHLDHLDRQLKQLKTQVRQAQQLSTLGTAAATIAHEFSNLLTPVLSYAEYALAEEDVDLYKKALASVVSNTRVLIGLSDRILSLTAAHDHSPKPVVVRTVVRAAADSLCRDFSKDGITFTVEMPETLRVVADELSLRQVFFNLFLNARDALATSRSGRLTVTARKTGEGVEIRVKDTGGGIPADLIDTLFDRLQTSKSTAATDAARCRGLGLALCKDLVEESRGSISVSSEPGIGTTFTILLPAVDDAQTDSETQPSAKAEFTHSR